MAFSWRLTHVLQKVLPVVEETLKGRLESVPQMYVASGIDVSKPLVPIKGYRLKSGSSDLAEKNWIPFVYESSLHFVYTPLPHYILGADLDCWVGDSSIFDWVCLF